MSDRTKVQQLMQDANELRDSFGTTYWLIGRFAEGMTHAESVAVPPFRANSFNWVLGHIVNSRNRVLALLGEDAVLREEDVALYRTGSERVSLDTAVPLERLLAALALSQDRIVAGLAASTPGELAAVIDAERGTTVAGSIAGLHWHETYHTGQLEILRQVAVERDPFP